MVLGLLVALGSVSELPHRHLAAGRAGEASPEAGPLGLAPTISADESHCPACFLQRLLSQSEGTGRAALEKPTAFGSIAGALDPLVVEGLPTAGSPRGPPPGV